MTDSSNDQWGSEFCTESSGKREMCIYFDGASSASKLTKGANDLTYIVIWWMHKLLFCMFMWQKEAALYGRLQRSSSSCFDPAGYEERSWSESIPSASAQYTIDLGGSRVRKIYALISSSLHLIGTWTRPSLACRTWIQTLCSRRPTCGLISSWRWWNSGSTPWGSLDQVFTCSGWWIWERGSLNFLKSHYLGSRRSVWQCSLWGLILFEFRGFQLLLICVKFSASCGQNVMSNLSTDHLRHRLPLTND